MCDDVLRYLSALMVIHVILILKSYNQLTSLGEVGYFLDLYRRLPLLIGEPVHNVIL